MLPTLGVLGGGGGAGGAGDGLSNASRLSFSSLPSISSTAQNHRGLLKDRKQHLVEQMAKIRGLLEEAGAEEAEGLPPLPDIPAPRTHVRKQPFLPEPIDEVGAMAMAPPLPSPFGLPGLRNAETPFGGNGSIRPWRHYFYRNLAPTPLAQSRMPQALRHPTPMRWGYPGSGREFSMLNAPPGPLTHLTEAAKAFQAETLPPAPGCLPNSVSSRSLLGTTLLVHE